MTGDRSPVETDWLFPARAGSNRTVPADPSARVQAKVRPIPTPYATSLCVGVLNVLSFGKDLTVRGNRIGPTAGKGGEENGANNSLAGVMEGLWARFRHLPALEIGRSSASRWRIPTIAQGDVLTINPVLSGAGAPIP